MAHRLLATLLSLVLLLGGCSKPSSPPVGPEASSPASAESSAPLPDPQPDSDPEPPARCGDRSKALPIGYVSRPYVRDIAVESGICEVTVDEEAFDVHFRLPAQVAREQIEAALSVDAPVPPRLSFQSPPQYRDMLLRFPPGQPGEVISIRLAGPVGLDGADASLGFRITRFPSPRITAELKRSDGEWEPLTYIPVLPKQPLAFRFRLHGGADPGEALEKIRLALRDVGHQIEQPTLDTLVVVVPVPPPLLFFDFQGVPGEHGTIRQGGATVYIGEPPRLVLLDPVTGQEEPVIEAPADLLRASLSPDGRWLMLSGMAPEQPWEDNVWLLDMQTKEMHLTPLEDEAYQSSPVVWLPDRLVLPVRGMVQVWHLTAGRVEIRQSDASRWQTASSDGRYIVGFDVDIDRETKQWLAPTTIFIHDVEQGTDQVLPDLVQHRVRHAGGFPVIQTTWEKDGRHVLIQDFQSTGDSMPDVQERRMRLNAANGEAEPTTGSVPARQGVQEWLPGPDGWQVRYGGDWDTVVLRAPGGDEQELGYGLVAGWTAGGQLLLVRWNPEQRRYRWMA